MQPLIHVFRDEENRWHLHARGDETTAWARIEDEDLHALLLLAQGVVTGDAPADDGQYLAEIMRVVDRHDAGEFGASLTVDQVRDIIRDRRAHGRTDGHISS